MIRFLVRDPRPSLDNQRGAKLLPDIPQISWLVLECQGSYECLAISPDGSCGHEAALAFGQTTSKTERRTCDDALVVNEVSTETSDSEKSCLTHVRGFLSDVRPH